MAKDFWSNATVAVMGAGSWGTVLAQLASPRVREVRLWVRSEETAREINSTRAHVRYVPGLALHERIHAMSDLDRVFDGGIQAVLWALPSEACREEARRLANRFKGDEILIHATKGVEAHSLKRVSEILSEEIPCRRIGVLSGPNLAREIALGHPAASVVASPFDEVVDAGRSILGSSHFRIIGSSDRIGVEWAGTLKNILAIAAGALDGAQQGWNARSTLITRGLEEMVRFGVALGAQPETFLGLAGIGDLLATCGSPLSRNYRVGHRLAQGDSLEAILRDLGTTAEGVRTTRSVWGFAQKHSIAMPITRAVDALLQGKKSVSEMVTEVLLG